MNTIAYKYLRFVYVCSKTTTCKTRPAGQVRPATRFCPARVIFFHTLVPGSGNFQLSRLAGLGYGLGLGFWLVITIIVSLTLTLTLITTLTVILP